MIYFILIVTILYVLPLVFDIYTLQATLRGWHKWVEPLQDSMTKGEAIQLHLVSFIPVCNIFMMLVLLGKIFEEYLNEECKMKKWGDRDD